MCEASSDIEKPICHECVCIPHTVIIAGSTEATQNLYPCYQSCFDPRDCLIINFTLNVTSNANPRDNIVFMISTPTACTCCSCFFISPSLYTKIVLTAVHLLIKKSFNCMKATEPFNYRAEELYKKQHNLILEEDYPCCVAFNKEQQTIK